MTTETTLEALDFSALVRPGDRVVWGQAGAEPCALTDRLVQQAEAIGPFRAFVGMSLSDRIASAQAAPIAFQSYCASGVNRALAKAGRLDILPCHYSQLAGALDPPGVLLLQLAQGPEGLSFGTAAEYLVPLLKSARVVVAEVNAQCPWTFGETIAPQDIDILVRTDRPLLELTGPPAGAAEQAIARHVAGLVDDGATLQLGIGSLPDAILGGLAGHRDLGIHSGALTEGVVELMQRGVINNSRKRIDAGVTVAGALFGGRRLYEFAHRNPQVQLRSTAYTHSQQTLREVHGLVTLNAAIEVDLTGQINAEVAGGAYVGAVGGAMDFLRGAHSVPGGLPIVALPSTAAGGKLSRIVAQLSGPVSSPRADAGIIVTEHGVADLRGRTLRERMRSMIAIAHPDFREALQSACS